MSTGVRIFTHLGRENWESRMIRGALLYHQIASSVCDISQLKESDDDVCVVLPSGSDRLDVKELPRPGRTRLLAGHRATLQYLAEPYPVPDGVIVVYGEPYRTVPRLAGSQELRARSQGKALLGTPYDPTEYIAVQDIDPPSPSLVITSLGCAKECAYCTYGCTYSRLYGKSFSRRSRPWRDIEAELIASLEAGVDQFQLTASQFLSENAEENEQIRLLAQHWDPAENGRPAVAFTVSPTDVLGNRQLVETLAGAFEIHPRLSIDSFDDRALDLFDRDYRAATAIEALEVLTAMELPVRVNYIFVHPGLDIPSIRRQIPYLKRLVSATSYSTTHHRLMLAYDIFSNSLLVQDSAPIAFQKGVPVDYRATLSKDVLNALIRVQHELENLITTARAGTAADPLPLLVEALESAVS